jgi:hypothetical protein
VQSSASFLLKGAAMRTLTIPPTANASGKTLAEAFCARHGCTMEEFRRRFFWRALHRHALPIAPLLQLGNHFAVDEDLIANCGRARSMHELREELLAHCHHPLNRGWLRRRLALRVSTHRLRRLAGQYLPGAKLAPPLVLRYRS